MDCKIEVVCKKYATATFYLWNDKSKEYEQAYDYSKTYAVGSEVNLPTVDKKMVMYSVVGAWIAL